MNQSMSLLHQRQFRSQNVDVSTGLRLAFHDQQKLHQHSLSSQCSGLSFLSEELSAQVSQQRDEIEHFIHAQGEELRRMLANKRQMHYCALLQAAEETISNRMKDKDAEAEKAKRHKLELEARAAHLSAEAQVWQARARAQEAEAAALQSQLQHAIMSQNRLAEKDEVALRCASGDPDDAESAYIDPERVVLASGPGCKACGKRVASVVLLPCRHLCVCTECDGVVSACPSCLTFRSSSIEVYMS
ncbi:E3 ubiquitin-protein ligase BOI-like [Bidens hawaiensis]|uniref:E3 ubiquitin-protein ligase BOI-like n=1 Tax=Bidens hawaiensis TaxID=980011 RepID=UPI00404936E3